MKTKLLRLRVLQSVTVDVTVHDTVPLTHITIFVLALPFTDLVSRHVTNVFFFNLQKSRVPKTQDKAVKRDRSAALSSVR